MRRARRTSATIHQISYTNVHAPLRHPRRRGGAPPSKVRHLCTPHLCHARPVLRSQGYIARDCPFPPPQPLTAHSEARHLEETIATLEFASRIRAVRNTAAVVDATEPEMMLKNYKQQVLYARVRVFVCCSGVASSVAPCPGPSRRV
jgi:hypothetical protein